VPEFLPRGATRRRFWAAHRSGNRTSSASKSTRGRRWLSRRPASASFALPKRPLIDRQSPRSKLLNRGRKYGAPSRNNPLGDEERKMAFKPNYNQQRADRNRAKAQKKQEKLKRLEEETAKRKAARGDEPNAEKSRKDA